MAGRTSGFGAIAPDTPNDHGVNAALGALCGGFLGLIVGTLGSGLFLAIYRLVRHARGRHD